MKTPTMLYICPGQHVTDGVAYDYTVVDESEVESHLADGWHRDWVQADAALKASAAERLQANERELAEVEQKLQAAPKARKAKG